MKYTNLKSFIEGKHSDILKEAINDYLKNNNTEKVFSVDSIHIETLYCKEERYENYAYSAIDIIAAFMNLPKELFFTVMNVGISCVIFDIENTNQLITRFFTANLKGDINKWCDSVKVCDVEETTIEKFVEGDLFNHFLLPDIDREDLEIWADKITVSYMENAVYDGYSLPIESIMQQLKMCIFEADLPENCLGRMYFRESKATIYSKFHPHYYPISRIEDADIKPGTILINKEMKFLGGESSQILTIAHEISHWYLHKNLFKLLELIDSDIEMFSCEEMPPHWDDKMDSSQKVHWYAEWQANELAIKVAMPRNLVKEALQEIYNASEKSYKSKGDIIQETLEKLSDLFSVPTWVGKHRLRQLEYDIFDGVCLNIDGVDYQPIYFTPGTLKSNQTFIINHSDYDKNYNNPNFAALIDNNKYIYLGHVVCMKNTKYIVLKKRFGKYCLMLSDYALEHADECCLVFNLKSTTDLKQPYEFYGQAYFNNKADSSRFIEHEYKSDYEHEQSDEERKNETLNSVKAIREIQSIYSTLETDQYSSFASKLIYHMKRKNIKVDDLSFRSKLSTTTIENYRNKNVNQIPIENVMAICIGLNLHEKLCYQMIAASGNTLMKNDKGFAYELLLRGHTGKGETIDHWNEILSDLKIDPIPYKRGNC